MSRSRKKHLIYKYKIRGGKRAASRAFRHYKGDIPVTKKQFFRRVYSSYDVWDDRWVVSYRYKDKDLFRKIVNRLHANFLDKQLSEEEAYELLDRLIDLRYSLKLLKK